MDDLEKKQFSDIYNDATPEAQEQVQAVLREYAISDRDLTESEQEEAASRISDILTLDRKKRQGRIRSLTSMLRILRDEGWMVAVHNDYRLNGKQMTFWLFTHPSGRWLKGEGESDESAVAIVFTALGRQPVY